MASLFRFHCDPTTELDRFFDDACNARFWPSGKEGGAYTSSTRHLDSFRPRCVASLFLVSILHICSTYLLTEWT